MDRATAIATRATYGRAAAVAAPLLACLLVGGCGQMPPVQAEFSPARASYEAGAVKDFQQAVELAAQGQYARAAETFERVVVSFEETGWPQRAAESWFWLGFCREKLGRTEEAADAYRTVLERYRNTPAARQADQRLANLAAAPR